MSKKSALATVFLVVLIDLMGFGIVLPLLPFYASEFQASPIAIGLLYSIYSLAQLVFSPLWGGFSDRIGRRPIMLMSTAGAVLAYLLFALSHSLTILFLSRLMAGIMGGNISTAQAYVADVTEPQDRAKGMGLIGAAFGIGFMAGPAMATFLIHPAFHESFKNAGFLRLSELIEQNKYAIPGFFAAGLSALSFLLVLLKLPETVEKGRHAEGDRITRSSVFSGKFWLALRRPSRSSAGPYLLPLLLFSVFLLSFGQSSLYSAFPLFCQTALALPPEKVGIQFAIMGLIAIVIQGGLMKPLAERFGEKRLFLTGNVLMVTGLALIPFASSEILLTLYLGIMAVGASLNGPALNSLISKEAPLGKTGSVMGTSQSFAALGRVIGPTWGGLLFGISIQLPFLATAFLVFLAFFVGFKLHEST